MTPILNAEMSPELAEAGRAAEQEGELDLALRAYGDALASVDPFAEATLAAELARAVARIYHKRGDYAEALEAAEQCLTHAERSGEPGAVVAALNALAISEQFLGRLDRAQSLYQRAADTAEPLNHPTLSAIIQQNLATIASVRGDRRMALEHYRSALKALRLAHDASASAHVLANIAMTHADLGDWPAAERAQAEAFALATQAGDPDLLAHVELNHAGMLIQQQRHEDARAHCDRALELYSRLESKSGLAATYKCYGLLYKGTAKPQLAEAHLLMVVQLARQCADPLLEAEAEYERALVYLDEGRNRDVLQALGRAERLFNELRVTQQVADIEQRLDRLQEMYLQVVRTWGESIEAKDLYTAGHCGRVADYACLLAEAAGFAGRDLVWVRMGAFLHDVGKMTVPRETLNKPGPLSDDEWAVMRTHTVVGDEIVADLQFPFDIRPMVRNHHEHWDGTGYPDRLAGAAIPLTARILCVADIYDALTTARAYRPAFTHEQALRIMDELADKGVDPELYRLFRVRVLGMEEGEAAAAVAGGQGSE
jgi:putative nucleotidyltransferase with HDIG domain